MRSRSMRLVAIGLGILLLGSVSGFAQTSASAISGQVTDQQNAVVPGAEIKVTNSDTGAVRTTLSNEAGRYSLINVDPGTYQVTVTKPGFGTVQLKDQKVDIGAVLTLNISLKVGQTTTTVVVEASAGSQLQTTTATVGSSITTKDMQLIPNLSREVSALVTLQPAVTPNGSVAGSVRDQSTFLLDGGNNSNDMDGTMTTYTPSYAANGSITGVMPTPIESIEEFKVGISNQTADFGNSAGAQVQMVTRRGTNSYHGAVYEFYFGNNVGSANDWVSNHTIINGAANPIPINHRNRFGWALGGPLLPTMAGGKTYFFADYELFRWNNSVNYERAVPTALYRAGVIQLPNAANVYTPYNINPNPVTVNGITYAPALCGPAATAKACDPRGIGLNPTVAALWKLLPTPNDPAYSGGDAYNTQGYLTNLSIPQKSLFFVTRLDHDFSDKWRFFASYRYYGFSQLTNSQVDIGGVLPGDTFGQAAAKAPRPQKPSYYVAGLTTNITNTLINNFNVNYLRNWWQWSTVAAPPQLAGLGGALEIAGESQLNSLIPYNVNTQSARQRFWDGQDWNLKDDLNWVKGKHLFQFGGQWQRNFDYHQRNDNGQGIMTSTVYQISSQDGATPAQYYPATLNASNVSNWNSLYPQLLGIVSQSQVAYTRAGSNLTLQPIGTNAEDRSIIKFYNLYFSDTWRIKPTLTLTYGLNYEVETPPYELDGKQVMMVDASNNQLSLLDYFDARKAAALQGQTYNPTIGFSLVSHVNGTPKYPYNSFYGGVSPRIAASWNPNFRDGLLGKLFGNGRTVIRGGYSRIYGRLNGVNQVLVPLLGPGVLQASSCTGVTRTGACQGGIGLDPVNAFRIGVDGLSAPLQAVSNTLPQPFFPGGANASAGDGTVIDPSYRPNRSDQFTVSVQRELNSKLQIEAGYIGRIIRNEFQQADIDTIPYMYTLGGQTFASAWANLYTSVCGLGAVCVSNAPASVPTQAWFEKALGGTGSSYCGSTSCTVAVATKQLSQIKLGQVYAMWSALERTATSWTLGRTLLSTPLSGGNGVTTGIYNELSTGYGNYNALYLSFTARNWHGLTARSNFTWNRSLGTGAVTQSTSSYSVVDPWNLGAMYGPQSFDIRFLYNLVLAYQTPWFKNGKGFAGKVLGGWTISPLFTAQSGPPIELNTAGDNQHFGEINPSSSGSTNESLVSSGTPFNGGNSSHYGVNVSGCTVNGIATAVASGGNTTTQANLFADPCAVYAQFRRPVLGLDVNQSGVGAIRGLPTWNVDVAVVKDVKFTERLGATFHFQITNVLNHMQLADPTGTRLSIDSPSNFGLLNSQPNTNSQRKMEFGIRFFF